MLTTYAALAHAMNISRRHAIDLIRVLAEFGYIRKLIRTASRGWHVGLAVLLAEKTLPVNERAELDAQICRPLGGIGREIGGSVRGEVSFTQQPER